MKKYLLLIISMVCAVTGAWADIPSGATAIGENGSYYIVNGTVYTFHIESADKDLANVPTSVPNGNYSINNATVKGIFQKITQDSTTKTHLIFTLNPTQIVPTETTITLNLA